MTPRKPDGRLLVVLALLAALLPALAHVSSPWWAPSALGWAARRFWSADLSPASASFNPFTLSLEARGGTLAVPARSGVAFSGELTAMRAEADIAALARHRSIGSLELDLASLTLTVDPDWKSGMSRPAPGPPPPAPAGDGAPPGMSSSDTGGPGSRQWNVARVRFRIDRGTISYGTADQRRELSMDLGLTVDYRDVKDMRRLGQRLLNDLAQGAALGFVNERLSKP